MKQNLNNIQAIIEKNIPLIKYHSWVKNDKPKTDGKYYVSKEYLDSLDDKDAVIGKYRYTFDFADLKIADKLYSHVEKMFPSYTPYVSGHFYYPKGGYMSWHTNSDKPEKHIYITYVDEPNKSFFRSSVDGKIITDWDSEKLNVRVFDVVDKEPFYWHCVYSECNRYSFGFRLFEK
jgi:hypothetical protein